MTIWFIGRNTLQIGLNYLLSNEIETKNKILNFMRNSYDIKKLEKSKKIGSSGKGIISYLAGKLR